LVIIGLSESNIFIQWGILELTRVRFIPLIIRSGTGYKTQAGIKYFLSQAPASILILLRVILFTPPIFYEILNPALIFKLAMPPFHGWLFSLIDSIGINELSLLLTVQKFIPLLIIEIRIKNILILLSIINTIYLLIVFNISVRSIKPILIISSISRAFWPIRVLQAGGVWFEFMIFYSFLFLLLCNFLRWEKIFTYNNLINKNMITRFVLSAQLFNLGGVPPLTGFFLKILIIKSVIRSNTGWAVMLLLISFFMLYFYLQLITPLILATPIKYIKIKITKPQIITLFLILSPILMLIIY